jgi:hypothetical protein
MALVERKLILFSSLFNHAMNGGEEECIEDFGGKA